MIEIQGVNIWNSKGMNTIIVYVRIKLQRKTKLPRKHCITGFTLYAFRILR